MTDQLKRIRSELGEVDLALLELLNRRARIVLEIQRCNTGHDIPAFLPEREEMLAELVRRNTGPLSSRTIHRLFSQIIEASAELIERSHAMPALVRAERLVVRVGGETIGGDHPTIIAGPCAVESEAQMEAVARGLAEAGVHFLRGGRSSPAPRPTRSRGWAAAACRSWRPPPGGMACSW